MAEKKFGNSLSPWHFFARLEGRLHVAEIEIGGVVGNIGQRHVGVKKFQCLLFGHRGCGLSYLKKVFPHQLHLLIEVVVHLCAVFII